ncbi:MAG: SH3 domain-containing protein [Kiritimatiellae bacterium]|nr:SH3 domain-containing protein [Kiritimatiellia bacterium]
MLQFKHVAAALTRRMIMAAALVAAAAVVTAAAATMSVQVKDAPVRATPSFVGKVVGALAYGDQVEIQQTQGAWSKVAGAGVSGWMHTSALSSKKIVLAAGQKQANVAASGDELALAGKGFNSDVEAQFKAGHKDIDFTWINRMEKIRISAAEMQVFLQNGGVTPKEGGAK